MNWHKHNKGKRERNEYIDPRVNEKYGQPHSVFIANPARDNDMSFSLSYFALKDDMRKLLTSCFGMDERILINLYGQYVGYSTDRILIICTTAQFGRFIILRNNMGMKNGIKDLDAQFVIKERNLPKVFDVRGFKG